MTYSLGTLRGAAASSSEPAAGAAAPGGGLARLLTRWRLQLGMALGVALGLFWLVAMLTHHAADAAFSTSGDGQALHNRAGLLGAWVSDLSYVLFGGSVWWCLLAALRTWLATLAQLLRSDPDGTLPRDALGPVFWRPRWMPWVGLALLLMASCTLEWTRLYRFESLWPGAHAGGVVGALLGPWSMKWLGFVGSGVVWIVVLLLGMAWALRFSWLGLAESIGGWFDGVRERRIESRERAEDLRIGERAQRERERVVKVERQFAETQHPIVIDPPPPIPADPPPPPSTRVVKERQQPLFVELDNTRLPQVDLLDALPPRVETVTPESLDMTSRLVEKKLKDFGVEVRVVAAHPGPVITRYEIEPATGVKGSQVVGLAKDLARSLSLVSIRVVETIPGKNCMALELPNARRQMIRLAEILGSQVYHDAASMLTIGLGKDIVGQSVVADLAKMPHVLVAGTTGSGKSVGINAMILSLVYKAEARDVRLILIDPKMLEMSMYEGIPHLLAPVVTDMKQAGNALTWCVGEMERRYKLMSKLGVRNLAGYNKKLAEAKERGELVPNPFSLTPEEPEPLDRLPHIVVVIDELADLMMVVGKKIEELIARLAQKARASGIHLILATQRPSVDVITGLIKANIPTRIAFQVSSKIDSRTILDQMGAEALLGQGDMLYLAPGTGLPVRVHGAFVADDEVHHVVEHLKKVGPPNYVDGLLDGPVGEESEMAAGASGDAGDAEADPMYDQAVEVVLKTRRPSISLVQRHLRIGYNRAARLIEAMEKAGLVTPMNAAGGREVVGPARQE